MANCYDKLLYSFTHLTIMKVLFVCKGNIGRSQMARALFDKLSGRKSESAGAKVSEENKKIKLGQFDEAKNVIEVMREEEIDLTTREIKQVTPKMVKSSDIIIALAQKEDLPNFILESQKVRYWDIENPRGYDLENTRKTKDQIKKLIEEFIKKSN